MVRSTAVLGATLLLLASPAAADPTTFYMRPVSERPEAAAEPGLNLCGIVGAVCLHTSSNSTLRTDTNPNDGLRLPPGYFLDEGTWSRLDTEMKRLQDLDTALTTQNRSLRASASGWQPGWKTVTVAILVGFAGGLYVYSKF